MESLIGQTLGRYTILSELGRGGMAAVFLANDPQMDREVAVKVLPREFSYDRTYVERFKQEAKSIAKLSHPNILPVHDHGEDQGWTYIVMAYAPGGSLAQRIREIGNAMELDEIYGYMVQIGAALDFAHGRGIIHRDFKPANVLLAHDGHAYLTDFGIAKMAEATAQLTGSGLIGTPAYMAPEMSKKGKLSSLVDIYAAGVTLFQMLTGMQPYEADTPMGLLMAHLGEPVPDARYLRPDLPETMQYVVERAMAKDPSARYQKMKEMVTDLRAVVAGEMPRMATAQAAPRPVTDQGVTLPVPMAEAQTIREPSPRQVRTAAPVPEASATSVAGQAKPASARSKGGLGPLWLGGAAVGALAIIGGVLWALGIFPASQPPPQPTPTSVPTSTTEAAIASTAISLMPIAKLLSGAPEMKVGEAEYAALTDGQALGAGMSIRTDANSAALLVFAQGVSVELHPGSEITIDRLQADGATLIIELRQLSGTTYHWITPDATWQDVQYTLLTPAGTVQDIGTQYWAIQGDTGWTFMPVEGSILIDVGDVDEDAADDYLAHQTNGDCLLVGIDSSVRDCPSLPLAAVLTNGADPLPTQTPTSTAELVATGPPTNTPTSPPTATVAGTPGVTACTEGWLPASDCTCCGTTLWCANGEKQQYNTDCMNANSQCRGVGYLSPFAGCGCCTFAQYPDGTCGTGTGASVTDTCGNKCTADMCLVSCDQLGGCRYEPHP